VPTGVCRCRKYDRYHSGRLLRRDDVWCRPCDDNIHLQADKFGCDFCSACVTSFYPPILDRDIATFDPTNIAKLLHKRRDLSALAVTRGRA
jgi:hypothetical protein